MGLVDRVRGRRLYLDANVFIYALNGFPPYAAVLVELLGAVDRGAVTAVTSELTLAEVLVIPFRHNSAEEERRCRMLLRPRPGLDLVPITRDAIEAAARLRADVAGMRTPDAIHVATARRQGCPVLLTNDRRLKAAPDVEVILLSEAVSA